MSTFAEFRVTARSRQNGPEPETACVQFGSEIAAPIIKEPNWHRSIDSTEECEWKRGESAAVKTEFTPKAGLRCRTRTQRRAPVQTISWTWHKVRARSSTSRWSGPTRAGGTSRKQNLSMKVCRCEKGCAPPVGRDRPVRVARPRKKQLTMGRPLMEAATARERSNN
jgi:hypothetical protein